MNTAIASPTNPLPVPNGVPLSPAEYVKGLSPEDKQAVLATLLHELIELNGGGKGLIPFETPDGNDLGYYVPPKAAAWLAERDLPKLTPEREKELAERMTRLHTAIPISQMIEELRQQAEQLRKTGS